MSRVERVDMLLRQIEHETKVAFDEHSELLSQNVRLKAENAKLREEIEAAKHDLQVFSMSSVQLDAENAKLRELVRELLTDPDAWDYDFFTWRIEKLGIEVK